ncbi:MAG: LPS export ABC transporter periplasmic protein LptC [Bdellovibrionota bacterium]
MIKRPNFLFVCLVCVLVIVEILFLRPTSLETGEQATTGMFDSLETMVTAQKYKDEVGYTIDGFHYTAVEGEMKHWQLNATKAILFEKSRVVRARNARIRMFDPQGKVTLIEGDEAHYGMGERDLNLIGNVKVTFPDGFWLKTTKAHYSAKQGAISSTESFYGEAIPQKEELMQMWGVGFSASKSGSDIFIHNQARVKLRRLAANETTDVRSDKSKIDRFTKVAYFSMASANRFVESHQGTLFVRSRRQEATYDSNASVVKYMTAYEDVLIKETDVKKGEVGLKYATSQRADFLTQEDKILLSGFPSAYQAHDTLTGELITIYRKKNLVEVSHANAYHEGTARD